jgi:hypothetical protein
MTGPAQSAVQARMPLTQYKTGVHSFGWEHLKELYTYIQGEHIRETG